MRLLLILFLVGLIGCGGADDARGGHDAGAGTGPCGFGNDELLPYAAGYHWTYSVTDLTSGMRESKHQALELEGDELFQVTRKTRSTTRSLMRKRDGRVERLRQDKLDLAGTLVETSTYDPPQLRLDESDDRIVPGVVWDEVYTRALVDQDGAAVTIQRVDHWEVLGVDVPCDTPMGSSVCLRVRRLRTEGGTADKVFTFARGIGKIEESGGKQLEHLTDCWRE